MLGNPTLKLEQWQSVSLIYLSAPGAWAKLDTGISGLAAEFLKVTAKPGPASDALAGYLTARALRFEQFDATEDPTNPDSGNAGAIIYGGSGGLEIYGRNTADGLLASLFNILLIGTDLMVNAPGLDPDYRFRVDGDASKDAALINGFMQIVDRLTINGVKDPDHRLLVNGDTKLNGLLKVIWLC